jgi:exosortase
MPQTPDHSPAATPAEARATWHGKEIAGVVILVGFVALFFRFLARQGEYSAVESPEDWGHSFLIPLISGGLIWRQREKILSTPTATFWPGLLPLALGVVCYFYFVMGIPNHMLQGASMLLTLAGVCLLVLGPAVFRYLFLPIAYLAFAVTISEMVMNAVTFRLQLLATKGAWLLLKVISLPGNWFLVEASGNTLEVLHKGRSIPLNVAEACSGMRMVIAFIALAAAIALFQCKHWWQRAAVILLAVPVAILMNVIRVAVLGLASIGDVDLAAGNAHMIIGTLLLVPGLFLFLGCVWVLERLIAEPTAGNGGKP